MPISCNDTNINMALKPCRHRNGRCRWWHISTSIWNSWITCIKRQEERRKHSLTKNGSSNGDNLMRGGLESMCKRERKYATMMQIQLSFSWVSRLAFQEKSCSMSFPFSSFNSLRCQVTLRRVKPGDGDANGRNLDLKVWIIIIDQIDSLELYFLLDNVSIGHIDSVGSKN